MKNRSFLTIVFTLLVTVGMPAQAEMLKRKICVFDIAGNVGPAMTAMKDWKAAALEWGLEAELIAHTNEAIAAEDLKANRCSAALITGIRSRLFNKYVGTLDSIGSTPSMDHLRTVLQVLAHPQSAPKMTNGTYEIIGIAPAGAAYIFVNDRKINTLAKAAGKKVAVLDYDKTQAKLVSQVGATPVASDITNFSTKFNNGVVDVIAAPLLAYDALELYKGLSPNGAIIDFPVVQISIQLVARDDQFPDEIAQKSREYFYNNLDRVLEGIEAERQKVDQKWFEPIPEADKREYDTLLQQARVTLRNEGYYDPAMLTLLRKIRCKFDASRAECTTIVE